MQWWMIISVAGSMLLSLLFVNLAVMRVVMLVRNRLADDPRLYESIAARIQAQGFGTSLLKEKLLSPAAYASLLPQIEKHVDLFLNVKLKEQMPVVGMLVGERTIAQMKEIFLKELELLFPEVMEGYLLNLENDLALRKQIIGKAGPLASGIFFEFSIAAIRKSALRMNLLALIAGLTIGLSNLCIYFLAKP